MTDACTHALKETLWDHHRCKDCGWVLPDGGHKRGTDSPWNEWFPSMFAFGNYKKTGERPWRRENALLDEARWLFAQIAQMHSTDSGDIAERCMELGRRGYALLRRDRDATCEDPKGLRPEAGSPGRSEAEASPDA